MSREAKAGEGRRGPGIRTPLVSEGPFPGTVNAGLAWTMPSSSGRQAVTFTIRGVGSAGRLIVDVAIEADFFALGHEKLGDIVPDLRLRLCQAVVDTDSLRALLADLRRWETDHTPVRRQISAGSLPALTVEIGQRDGVICTPEQPVISVRYEGSLSHVERRFVGDQSCVAFAVESLARIVGAGGAGGG